MKFLVIGNLTKDVIRTKREERIDFGGAASYCSIAAKKLGCESHILTRGNHELDGWIKNLENLGVRVELQENDNLTCFVNDYMLGERKQFVYRDAGKIDFKDFGKVDVTHLGPVFNEVTLGCVKEARKNSKVVSLDVQGFMRSSRNKEVIKKFWSERGDFLKYVDLVKISGYEIDSVSKKKNYEDVFDELMNFGVKVVELTLGEKGSIVASEAIHKIPAYKTTLVDKTGSGDVFAATFAIRYFETKDALKSGLFASAAASFVVEDFGAKNIVNREKVEERFKELKGNLKV